MTKIIVLVGPPNSGKTTWTKNFMNNNIDYVKVSRDDIRQSLFNSWVVSNQMENVISKLQNQMILTLIQNNVNVILDNTHCKMKYIQDIIDCFGSSADIIFKIFDVDEHTLYARNEYRGKIDGKYIPDTVMSNMIKNFNELKETFDFKDIIHS